MTTTRRDLLTTAATLTGVAALPGCGLILHPERQGTRGGPVDGVVVLLDGLLCLCFLVPGVVAFAVDIATGCIYYTGRMEGSGLTRSQERRLRRRWLKQRGRDDIESFLTHEVGLPEGLDHPSLRVLADNSRVDADRLESLLDNPVGTESLDHWHLLEDAQGELVGFERIA